jgi:hypothetical protein
MELKPMGRRPSEQVSRRRDARTFVRVLKEVLSPARILLLLDVGLTLAAWLLLAGIHHFSASPGDTWGDSFSDTLPTAKEVFFGSLLLSAVGFLWLGVQRCVVELRRNE